ncbi:hypothetical protein KGY79_12840 [Candidatus Bipolaricaulota bacterium]|nr:hypothetical protein [Candidatus Bipolaricaulota bacterium]
MEFEISRGKVPILLVSQQVLLEPNVLIHIGIWAEGFGNEYIFGDAEWKEVRPHLWLGSASFFGKAPDGHPINHNTSRSNNSDCIIYDPNEVEPGDRLGDITGMDPLLKKLGGILLELDKDQIYSGIPNSTEVSQQAIIQSKKDRLPPPPIEVTKNGQIIVKDQTTRHLNLSQKRDGKELVSQTTKILLSCIRELGWNASWGTQGSKAPVNRGGFAVGGFNPALVPVFEVTAPANVPKSISKKKMR